MEEIQTLLARIATALEEANRINSEWVVTSTRWHADNEALITEQQSGAQKLAHLMQDYYQRAYDAWLEELKQGKHE